MEVIKFKREDGVEFKLKTHMVADKQSRMNKWSTEVWYDTYNVGCSRDTLKSASINSAKALCERCDVEYYNTLK